MLQRVSPKEFRVAYGGRSGYPGFQYRWEQYHMPELSEVELTRRGLLPRLRGRRILDFWTDWPRGLRAYSGKRIADSVEWMAADILGRRILNIERRGKVLFFRLSGKRERTMAIHLRMSGRLEVMRAAKAAHAAKENRWMHFWWQLSGGRELRFVDPRKFGLVWYGAPEELLADSYLGALGEDPHRLTFSAFDTLLRRGRAARVAGEPRQGRGMVKPYLLRQDRFAGIGNIIADEALWRARIHPRAPIAHLSLAQARDLHGAIVKTIGLMLDAGGTTLRNWGRPDGRAGRYQEERRAYGKAGKPCPRCGVILQRIVVGGRGTTICPKCQQV